jgi:hypothetical protein
MADYARAAEAAAADARRGFSAGFEDILVAALVALPFTGTLAILLGAFGLPGWLSVLVAGVAQGFGTFWIAGVRNRAQGS